MSFNNAFPKDLENAEDVSSHYKDFPEFESMSQTIDNLLYNINNNQLVSIKNLLSQYEKIVKSTDLELQQKAAKLSKKISEVTSKCTDSFKNVSTNTQGLNDYLKECERNHEDEDTINYLRQKEAISLNLIKTSLHQFQQYQRQFSALQRENVDSTTSRTSPTEEEDGQENGHQQQQQISITYEPINAEELEQQTLLIEEREREIHQIAQDTQEINEIFQNLQGIVQEQQFQIDNIEDNILSYSTDAQGASRELRKAERYQKRAGGRMLCCLFILLGVFGSVILIGLIF